MAAFLQICLSRAGADSMITPREMLRDYMTVLNILMQNPDATFEQVVGSSVTLAHEGAPGEGEDAPVTRPEEAPVKKYTIDELEF